ncbi:MAG TPA: hypothetical protein PJ986_12705 [Gammaproteobacteria bacterium]|nr:hypothetical protein [Gammaproteobacteria bacterium]
MTNCVVDVNDFELRARIGDGEIASSPGYACAVDGQVELGARALAQAQLHPRTTENRFWRDLDTAPLTHFGKRVRHHADLVWLHLEHLRGLLGHVDGAVFAVPGSLSHEQLSLLLGVAPAAKLKPIALVDSAVAAGAAALGPGQWAHVDLQQHQAVVTVLEVGAEIRRGTVEVLPGLGINALRAACVRAVTRAFVAHCRFDPLHHAETEQLLYDQLARWIELLARSPEINVQLTWRGGRFDTRLSRATIAEAATPLLARLRAALPASLMPVASHRLAAQPGYAEVFGATPVLSPRAVFDALRAPPPGAGNGIRLVTSMRACESPTILAPAQPGAAAATHVLDHHLAFALSRAPLYLLARGGCTRTPEPLAWCSIALGAHGAELTTQDARVRVNGQAVVGRIPLAAGDQITFTGAAALFTMIAVQGADDA